MPAVNFNWAPLAERADSQLADAAVRLGLSTSAYLSPSPEGLSVAL